MQGVLEYISFLQIEWRDLFEILLVAYLIYRILLLWTGTRAFQILFGLVLLVAVFAVARLLQLGLITYILSQVFTYGAFAMIVVFQPELRSSLARLGRSRVWRILTKLEEREKVVADEVATAAERLSRAKIGGLVAVEREVGLEEYAETGTAIQAQVSADLLTTIFTPYSPLHDGAVIVRGDQIVAAGCILPLTQFPISDKSLGTRHRAAIGLSEETDAFVVVISEETSKISLARRGVLRRGMTAEQLRVRLAAEEQKPIELRRDAQDSGEIPVAALSGAEASDALVTRKLPEPASLSAAEATDSGDGDPRRGRTDDEAGVGVIDGDPDGKTGDPNLFDGFEGGR
jgi:diadenylate cyclase